MLICNLICGYQWIHHYSNKYSINIHKTGDREKLSNLVLSNLAQPSDKLSNSFNMYKCHKI